MRRTLTATLRNAPGVLNRFTGVLSRRQINIESLCVGLTEVEDLAQVTVIVDMASYDEVKQVMKQFDRLVDVVCICDSTDQSYFE
ncbi:acetolactate synthase small subunit [Streptococcus ruminantium]|uniref:acetolactate synthase small subunit n=1 Tax=Streptococcus ruminantium TaxID=1917441 RepID=UPI0012DEC8F0|nr:acetolactate synthase small subunit [Streptococcus ruminantium]